MMHEPQAPVTNEHDYETHPAFGSIRANRLTTTPGAVLFDSEITHSEFVRVSLAPMERKRDLNRDWLHAGQDMVTVDMSMAQWGAFVSSFGSPGVPCTVRSLPGQHDVPGLEHDPRLALSMAETKRAAHDAFDEIQKAFEALEALPANAGVKARREAMNTLRARVNNAPGNVAFAAMSLNEHVENVVTKARADIEAMAAQAVAHHRDALDAQEFPVLEVGNG